MTRRRGVAVPAFSLLFLSAAVAAQAQTAGPAPVPPPQGEGNRFTYHRADDGFARLDLRTGEVSLCKMRSAGWECRVAADDRAAYEAEIGRLQSENAALKKALLDRGLPLPSGVTGPAAAAKPDKDVPGDAEVDRVMSFVETIWRRLVEMMGNIQRDLGKS